MSQYSDSNYFAIHAIIIKERNHIEHSEFCTLLSH